MGERFEEIDDGATVWRFDRTFLASNWTCIWGRGCLGILAEPAEHLGQGCCSVGARFTGEEEAAATAALAATLDPARFQFHREAVEGGIFADDAREGTRLVEGACIFLNRPGFAGGPGCALHLAALDDGESPLDWKPAVCWQLPLRLETEQTGAVERVTVRAWERRDWGDEPLAWCCTEGDRAYVGDRPVVDSLGEHLERLAGREVVVELRRRLAADGPGQPA